MTQLLSTNQVAQKLLLTPTRIAQLCSAGRFKGAFQTGSRGRWRIPCDSVVASIEPEEKVKIQRSVVDRSVLQRLKEKTR